MAPPSSSPPIPTLTSHHLNARLAHPHYFSSALLTLPFPITLGAHLASTTAQIPPSSWAILSSLPVLLASVIYQRTAQKGLLAEVVVSEFGWSGKVFNLCAFLFLRTALGLGWYAAPAYALVWLVAGFLWPQPEYLGPNKMSLLNAEEFDDRVAIVPPAISLSAPDTPLDINLPSTITELPDPAVEARKYEQRRQADPVWRVVLFHADWIRKSRELEMTLAHMSNELSSPTLAFHLVTPDSAPSTFDDLDLPTTATSTALPVVFLFHKGRAVAQLPRGQDALVAERREKRAAARRARRAGPKKIDSDEEEEGEEEGSDEDGSDDEREVEREVAWERRKWDRSAGSIERAFRLRERSGVIAKE